MCLSLDYFLHFVSFTVASSSNTSSTDPKSSDTGNIAGGAGRRGVVVVVVVVVVIVGVGLRRKRKNQSYTVEEEI